MTYKKSSIIFLIIANISLFTSCSLLPPIKTEPTATYIISSVPHYITKKSTQAITLLVTPLDVNPLYNTTDMLYSTKLYEVASFTKNRWAETPAKMLQPLILQALFNTHYFHALLTESQMGHYDFVLNTQLLQLQQDFTHNPSMLRLLLRAQLIKSATNKIIATKEFSVAEVMSQRTPYAGVIAANKATAKLLSQLTEFCLRAPFTQENKQ